MVGRSPRACGYLSSRWTLAALRAACPWLWVWTDAGMQQVLRRLHISWQRARSYIHSPDPDYAAKLANVQAVRMLARRLCAQLHQEGRHAGQECHCGCPPESQPRGDGEVSPSASHGRDPSDGAGHTGRDTGCHYGPWQEGDPRALCPCND
jgi:hypothetical protein